MLSLLPASKTASHDSLQLLYSETSLRMTRGGHFLGREVKEEEIGVPCCMRAGFENPAQ